MDDELYRRTDVPDGDTCPSCGEPMSFDLFLTRTDGLKVWQEGLCLHCQHRTVMPLPEVFLVMDEASRWIMAN